MKKRIAILGSTGSIGTQTIEVVLEHPNLFAVEVLTANYNYKLLIEQAVLLQPNAVVIGNKEYYSEVRSALEKYDIKVYAGSDSINQIVEMSDIDVVMLGIVGIEAIKPLISSLKANKTIALANKESIVAAGRIIRDEVMKSRGNIIPVDSEHSAIFQSIMGEAGNDIHKLVLTASGGPFYNIDSMEFDSVTPAKALAHPNWNMGPKVSIDSATLMNKGLEAIEAHWLFDIDYEKIEILIHPQSFIHSMVYFTDGTIKTLMSNHDMKIPIGFSLTYPNRLVTSNKMLNLTEISKLEFHKPDVKKFRNLALAFEAMKMGGNMPCILNAGNDVAVFEFLNNRIGFPDIYKVVEGTMNMVKYSATPSLDDIFIIDAEARKKAYELINKIN